MKQKKLSKKLVLNKETVTNLVDQRMAAAKGGREYTDYPCHTLDWGTECSAGYGCSDPICIEE
ncbi:MAG: hypothetical protein GY940_08240 [bacterium]|nr:hypothetical protein [bacterium]